MIRLVPNGLVGAIQCRCCVSRCLGCFEPRCLPCRCNAPPPGTPHLRRLLSLSLVCTDCGGRCLPLAPSAMVEPLANAVVGVRASAQDLPSTRRTGLTLCHSARHPPDPPVPHALHRSCRGSPSCESSRHVPPSGFLGAATSASFVRALHTVLSHLIYRIPDSYGVNLADAPGVQGAAGRRCVVATRPPCQYVSSTAALVRRRFVLSPNNGVRRRAPRRPVLRTGAHFPQHRGRA